MNKTYLYPYSAEEARRRNEMSLWRASHKANLACKEEIELAIGTHFDGTHLEEGCAEGVIREYGYKRVQWVLSHTIQQLDWSDRFSQANYVAIFEGTAIEPLAPLPDSDSSPVQFNWAYILVPLGVVFAAGGVIGGCLLYKRKHESEEESE